MSELFGEFEQATAFETLKPLAEKIHLQILKEEIERRGVDGVLEPVYYKGKVDAFEYEYTRTGVRYATMQGLHDDCVCALALADRCVTAPKEREELVIYDPMTEVENRLSLGDF